MKKSQLNKGDKRVDNTITELHEAMAMASDAKTSVENTLMEGLAILKEDSRELDVEKTLISKIKELKRDIELVLADLKHIDISLKEKKLSRETFALCEDLKSRVNKLRNELESIRSDAHEVEELTSSETELEKAERDGLSKLDKIVFSLRKLEEKLVNAIEENL